MEQYLGYIITKYGYFGIFTALSLGVIGLPIPDELLLTYVGYNIFKGNLHAILAFLTAFSGASTGITISFIIGRKLGLPFLKKYGPKFHISEERIESTQRLFEKYGNVLLVLGYFIPGIRHLTAYVAGISNMDFQKFMFFAYTGAFIWSIAFISLGHELGQRWYLVGGYIHRYRFYILLAIVFIAVVIFVIRKLNKPKAKENHH